jgi:hypothetical protein
MKAGWVLCFCAVFSVFLIPCCSRPPQSSVEAIESPEIVIDSEDINFRQWHALAIVQSGNYPLWFEFSAEGLDLIASPAEASLVDYVPWPHAKYCAGMLDFDEYLVLVINRLGFLVIMPEDEQSTATFYLIAQPANWDEYTTGSVFIYEEKPAVLLYRDVFFTSVTVPALEHSVMVLCEESSVPRAAVVPALVSRPGDEWEANALRQGTDGFWYYRFARINGSPSDNVYFKTQDLSVPGNRISHWEFRNSAVNDTLDIAGQSGSDLQLPPLPEGFVYTNTGLAGNVFVAAWEEQDEFLVGAAGIMVLDARAIHR